MAQHARLYAPCVAKLKGQSKIDINITLGERIELWPPEFKTFIFQTPFERPLPPGETAQAPELGCFSTNQDKIWCVNVPLVDVASYQILSGLVEKPLSYKVFHFYYKIPILLHFIVRKKSLF